MMSSFKETANTIFDFWSKLIELQPKLQCGGGKDERTFNSTA